LIPKLRDRAVGIYTEKQIALSHRQFAKATGIQIRPKDGRTSFGQNLIDHGFTVDEVSKRMRHATVATTQNFYIELRPDDDFERLKARYERAGKANPRRIEPKDEQILYR
jgi:integrase